MQIESIRIEKMIPPKDDLFQKILKSKLKLKEGDIVAITSKVASIHEGRAMVCKTKRELAIKEADRYFDEGKNLFTIKNNILIRSCGIDRSNGKGFMILWPKNPKKTAEILLKWLKRKYKVKRLGLIITDSNSIPFHRGAVGFSLAHAGFSPIYDYRGKKDIFGRKMKSSQANVADALAACAVLSMGEGNEQTPIAVIKNAPRIVFGVSKGAKKKSFSSFEVPFEEDIFSVFLSKVKWKKGKMFLN